MYCYNCKFCIKDEDAESAICDRPMLFERDVVTGGFMKEIIYCYDERANGGCGKNAIYFEEV